MKYSLLFLLALAIVSCSKNEDDKPAGIDGLSGNWVNIQYQDSIIMLERSAALNENAYGFTFQDDGTFVERKNAGWCGTPPIVFADFDGTWSNKDSLVDISVGYWGGTALYEWKILSITDKKIKILVISQEYQQN
jgi:hypothetical protein